AEHRGHGRPLLEALWPLLCLMDDADDFDDLLPDAVGNGEGRARDHKLAGVDHPAGAPLQGMGGQTIDDVADARRDLAYGGRAVPGDVAGLAAEPVAGTRCPADPHPPRSRAVSGSRPNSAHIESISSSPTKMPASASRMPASISAICQRCTSMKRRIPSWTT